MMIEEVVKHELNIYNDYELEKKQFYDQISEESSETNHTRIIYNRLTLTCVFVYVAFFVYLVFTRPYRVLKSHLKLLELRKKYEKRFFDENPYLLDIQPKYHYKVKSMLIYHILNKPLNFSESTISTDELTEESTYSDTHENLKGSETLRYSIEKKDSSEYSVSNDDTENKNFLKEIMNVFDLCEEMTSLKKIANLYSNFCAYAKFEKKLVHTPDSRVFLEWFLIKQIALRKRMNIKSQKKSIYSY